MKSAFLFKFIRSMIVPGLLCLVLAGVGLVVVPIVAVHAADQGKPVISSQKSTSSADGRGALTVAVVITAQQADGSDWDVGFGADLVLCGAKGCYVSHGLSAPAVFYAGGSGLRLLKKAGACRDTLKCVFRGVELQKLITDQEPFVQLVDVDYVSHTYLPKTDLRQNFGCQFEKAIVSCKQGVHGAAFSLWALPETLADRAGRAGLDQVLFKGVMQQRPDALTVALGPLRQEVKQSVKAFYKLLFDVEVPSRCLAQAEFLSETFYVVGLADATQRRAEVVLKDFVGERSLDELRAVVQRAPQIYWAFVDLVRQLKGFALASQAVLEKETVGVRLLEDEDGARLVYGWQVEARARALLQSCEVELEVK